MKRSHTLIPTLFLMTILSCLVLTCPTFAQDRPCAADTQKFCKDVEPSNSAGLLQCLKAHEATLSDACQQRLQTFAHEPCAEDAMKLCKDVEPGNKRGMLYCLKEHETEVSDACKERLHGFWASLL